MQACLVIVLHMPALSAHPCAAETFVVHSMEAHMFSSQCCCKFLVFQCCEHYHFASPPYQELLGRVGSIAGLIMECSGSSCKSVTQEAGLASRAAVLRLSTCWYVSFQPFPQPSWVHPFGGWEYMYITWISLSLQNLDPSSRGEWLRQWPCSSSLGCSRAYRASTCTPRQTNSYVIC